MTYTLVRSLRQYLKTTHKPFWFTKRLTCLVSDLGLWCRLWKHFCMCSVFIFWRFSLVTAVSEEAYQRNISVQINSFSHPLRPVSHPIHLKVSNLKCLFGFKVNGKLKYLENSECIKLPSSLWYHMLTSIIKWCWQFTTKPSLLKWESVCLNEYFCLKSLVVRENVKILYVTTFYFGGT